MTANQLTKKRNESICDDDGKTYELEGKEGNSLIVKITEYVTDPAPDWLKHYLPDGSRLFDYPNEGVRDSAAAYYDRKKTATYEKLNHPETGKPALKVWYKKQN